MLVTFTKLDGALKFKREDGVINYYPKNSIRATKTSDTTGQLVKTSDNGSAERFDFKNLSNNLGTSNITAFIDKLYTEGYIEYSN